MGRIFVDQLNMQTQDNESQQADQQTPGGQWNSIQMSGFSGFQMNPCSPSSELISLHTTQDLKDMILMDTGSMLSVFMNETFLKDIRPSESTCWMSTNNGSKQLTHEGVLPGHHELVHYDPTSIANIMAFCKVLKDPTVRRVVYDSDVEDAFVIHKMDGTIFKKGNVLIDFCPTDDMIADYMTKPLQGAKFLKFKKLIMGHD
jgi:hypothetical protein